MPDHEISDATVLLDLLIRQLNRLDEATAFLFVVEVEHRELEVHHVTNSEFGTPFFGPSLLLEFPPEKTSYFGSFAGFL